VTQVPNASVSKVRCPSCGGLDIRPSQRDGILDNIMTMLRRSPYRCRGCRRRFYLSVSPKPVSPKPEPAVEKEV
jgi:hypothetical protein